VYGVAVPQRRTRGPDSLPRAGAHYRSRGSGDRCGGPGPREGGLQDASSNLHLHLCLQTLMARIQTAATSSQAGRIWAAAQNLAELLLVTGKFLDDAPEPNWTEEFPPALCGLEAVRREFSNFASVLGWPQPPDQFDLDEVAQALHSAGHLIDPAPEAPLCQYLAGASRDLVRETHIAWIESHLSDGQDPSPAEVYGWYWNETLGGAALDGAKVEEAAATASAVAKWMGLDEVVEYLRDPDQVAYYGMMNVLPATPIRWSLENEEAADRHLHYGLARWYHRPLEASVVPIDVITGVLRTRRPYYYHHMLAHALVQAICLQRVLPPGIVADAIVGKLAAFCDLMLDGVGCGAADGDCAGSPGGIETQHSCDSGRNGISPLYSVIEPCRANGGDIAQSALHLVGDREGRHQLAAAGA
jgi:hypothetical protein